MNVTQETKPVSDTVQGSGGGKGDETVTVPKTEYEQLKKDAAEYLDGWKRAQADYINFKRDTEARQAEVARFTMMSALIGIIPLYDHLQKAVKSVSEENMKDPWTDGIVKICQEFEKVLRDAGVAAMKTVGHQFDPQQHEAVGREKREGTAPDTIVQEVKAGYTFHGKVMIPAHVIVNMEEES